MLPEVYPIYSQDKGRRDPAASVSWPGNRMTIAPNGQTVVKVRFVESPAVLRGTDRIPRLRNEASAWTRNPTLLGSGPGVNLMKGGAGRPAHYIIAAFDARKQALSHRA